MRVNAEQAIERVRFIESAGATRRTLTGPDMKRVPGLIEPDPVRAVTASEYRLNRAFRELEDEPGRGRRGAAEGGGRT